MDPEAKLPYCDQHSMMALVNNQDDPRMKPLHGQTEFAYIAFCGLMITLFTTHPGLTHAAVDSFLKLIAAVLGKVKNVVQKSFGDVKESCRGFSSS